MLYKLEEYLKPIREQIAERIINGFTDIVYNVSGIHANAIMCELSRMGYQVERLQGSDWSGIWDYVIIKWK